MHLKKSILKKSRVTMKNKFNLKLRYILNNRAFEGMISTSMQPLINALDP